MTAAFAFTPPAQPGVAIEGTDALFPIRRIFCVGRNYRDHMKEMGLDPDREEPFYFTKSAHAYLASGRSTPYPPGTGDYHHEMELVIAIGAPGFHVTPEGADALVFGYACGLDMTRRDLQLAARAKGRSWDLGKDIEDGAVVAAITPKAGAGAIEDADLALTVNGEPRQTANLRQLIWSPAEIVGHLSRFYHLEPGDLIFTGTPEGVGPINRGDVIEGHIDRIGDLTVTID
ncbi:MAG: fumarylacetoacetate hydrolase family protein, partial [Caulobacterales bacterium]|nr:fumarylacetoacetate hydrolase family protein [Caulobacterales bacterium]